MTCKAIRDILASIILACFFCTGAVANAYDLPKIKIEKPKKDPKKSEDKQKEDISQKDDNSENNSDKNKKDKPDVPMTDKNYVLIGEYKGFKYYLDKYSIKIKTNKNGVRKWSQFIFPIGSNVTPINAKSTLQKFSFENGRSYNSFRKTNELDKIEDAEIKEFLSKCFEVGYKAAFEKSR